MIMMVSDDYDYYDYYDDYDDYDDTVSLYAAYRPRAILQCVTCDWQKPGGGQTGCWGVELWRAPCLASCRWISSALEITSPSFWSTNSFGVGAV